MTNAEIAKKIAKRLFNEFKTESANAEQTSFTLSYLGRVSKVTDGKGTTKFVFDHSWGTGKQTGVEMPFTEDTYAIRDMAGDVYREFKALAEKRLKKGMMMLPKFKTMQYRFRQYGWWDSRDVEVFSSVTFIKPCKEFAKVNKKVAALGLKEIDPMKWKHCGVFGKRADYHVTDCTYLCTSSERCNEVLGFLKGKKKAQIDYVRHDYMEDREYGIRYETEWSGSFVNALKITTLSGSREFGC